jgi:hypothetical protein
MKTGEKARAKGNADPGVGPETAREAGQTIDRARHSPNYGSSPKAVGASLTGQRPRNVFFGKSRRKDKIIDDPNNSD